MENVIEVRNLVHYFGKKSVLKGLHFEVEKGETFGFLGPSGSGKTTTIKILTSQLIGSKGEIRIFGQPQADLKRIGILTDNSGLYDRLTVYDNLVLFCDLYGTDRARISDVLDEVNLAAEGKTVVKKLSKGMKQRVTLARAILHKPDLLFLDEPTSALDPVNRTRIHTILRRLNAEGTTIFLTTHDMQEAEELCHRVAFLNAGEIKAMNSPQALRLHYSDESISLHLKENKTVVVERNEAGAAQIQDYIANGELLAIHSNEPTLGDIFMQLTGRDLV
ncbi:ABC transporter ATP-binding protein [Domibacillus aminovorans]|uniref:Bacitracin ABC transporter ATP-binding protein n=1 Tax=Domibacillus aminovorans TaxID=29332 RepID=A0A177L054_9BACI|nr:ABC transporter ATP-binding protein [Domibacillus aminovorans]OAH59018.1 bacitracin ABC transporter ATP-binding protein [Domibacillus aminovorans]